MTHDVFEEHSGLGAVLVPRTQPSSTHRRFVGTLDLGSVQHGTMASDVAVTSILLDTIPTIV